MENTEWKEKYPKKIKPAYAELLDFFQPRIRALFIQFDREMNERFNARNKYHRYLPAQGWVYGYGRSYGCELLSVSVNKNCFNVLNIAVNNEDALNNALSAAQKLYDGGFEEHYAAVCEQKRGDQKERSKRRMAREKTETEQMALTEPINPDKFNKFAWCKKVSRNDLNRLYQGEAAGMIDEALLDDIGLTFYTRCKQAKDVRGCMEKGQIICLHCGAVLTGGRVSRTGSVLTKSADNYTPLNCACGYSYTYREYRRSCNAVNMPGGRAAPIFDRFIQKWPLCYDAASKMLLIDRLIHECHTTLMSGAKGRSAGVNLIEGTLKQVSELIIKLAYE